MGKGVVLAVALLACTPIQSQQNQRWPLHRKAGDARIAELEKQVHEMQGQIDALKRTLIKVIRVVENNRPPPPDAAPADDSSSTAPAPAPP